VIENGFVQLPAEAPWLAKRASSSILSARGFVVMKRPAESAAR